MEAFNWMSRSAFPLLYLGFFLLLPTLGVPSYKIGRQLQTVTTDTATVPSTSALNNGGTTVSSAVGTFSKGTDGISSQQGATTSTNGGTTRVSHGTATVNSVKSTLSMTTTQTTETSSAVPTKTMSTPTVTTTGENTSQKFSTLSPSTMASTEPKGSTSVSNTTAEMQGTIPQTMPGTTVLMTDTINTTVKAPLSTASGAYNQTNSTNTKNITASMNPRNSTTATTEVNQTRTTDTYSSSIMTTVGNVTGQGSSSVLNPDQVKGLIMICTTIGFLTILSIVSYSLKVCWWDKRSPGNVEKGRKVYEVPPTAPRKVPKRKKSLPRDPRRAGRRGDDLDSDRPYQTFDYDKYDHAYIQPVDHHPSGRYVYAYGGSSKSSLGSMPEEPEDVYLELHE
ncbi:uncharacterized protein LOC144884105 [Branchiostoma floridae x Branchiostoma japonicum]